MPEIPENKMKTNLRILTWNTCCDPTMRDRIGRKKRVHQYLQSRARDLDIIAIQEMSSFRAGPLFYLLYRLLLPLAHRHPHLFMLLDYCMMLEGLILPLVTVDNTAETLALFQGLGFHHSRVSDNPRYYMNSGLVLVSRYSITGARALSLQRDTIHRPGALMAEVDVKGKKFQILNCHLVPTLDNSTIPYRICNSLNRIAGKNPADLRGHGLAAMKGMLKMDDVMVAGDFNVDRNDDEEYRSMLDALGLKSAVSGQDGTHIDGTCEKQIDYILVTPAMKVLAAAVMKDVDISDHFPLTAVVEW